METQEEVNARVKAEMEAEDRRKAIREGLAFADTLQEVARFYQENPSFPVPYGTQMDVFVRDKATLKEYIRRIPGRVEKVFSVYFSAVKRFGPQTGPGQITFRLNADRELVCEKVVKGTKIIPAVPEREVEDVDWVCDDPILKVTEADNGK